MNCKAQSILCVMISMLVTIKINNAEEWELLDLYCDWDVWETLVFQACGDIRSIPIDSRAIFTPRAKTTVVFTTDLKCSLKWFIRKECNSSKGGTFYQTNLPLYKFLMKATGLNPGETLIDRSMMIIQFGLSFESMKLFEKSWSHLSDF